MSHKIEERVLNEKLAGYMFVSFQYFSRFYHRREMFEQLGKHVRGAYIFGYPDVEVPAIENVTFVPLKETDRLIYDWFLVYHGPEYYTALVSQQDNSRPKAEADPDRQYNCLWTFDLDIIKICSDWLIGQLGANTLPLDAYDHDEHGEHMDANLDDYLELPDDPR